jgi:hypothetical protein
MLEKALTLSAANTQKLAPQQAGKFVMRTFGYKIAWLLEEAFAVRAIITAIGTGRARVMEHCRSFLEGGKRRRR